MPATAAQKYQADQMLKELGWEALKADRWMRFQQGFGYGALAMDNDPGPLTLSAMAYSIEKGGTATPNFMFREWLCPQCGEIRLHRDLARGLEIYRAKFAPEAGVGVRSGCRCPAHNRAVGGVDNSVHLTGGAIDSDFVEIEKIIALGIFSGIGALTSTREGRHLDVRGADRTVPNYSGGQPDNPTLWGYNPKTGKAVTAPKAWAKFPLGGPGLPPLLTWKGEPEPEPELNPPALAEVIDLGARAAIRDHERRLIQLEKT